MIGGCIGECISGLSIQELDTITDNIYKTLSHPQGRKIFREFLRKSQRQDELGCLDFYEKCCSIIEHDRNYVLSTSDGKMEELTNGFGDAFEMAIGLDGVPQIDASLLEKFNEALNIPCRAVMLQILEETKLRLEEFLFNIHGEFKAYIVKPCPTTAR